MQDEQNQLSVNNTSWNDYSDFHLNAVRLLIVDLMDPAPFTMLVWSANDDYGVMKATNIDLLQDAVRMSRDELLAEPNAFIDCHGTYHAPFVTAVTIAQRICGAHARPVLLNPHAYEQFQEFEVATVSLFDGFWTDPNYTVQRVA